MLRSSGLPGTAEVERGRRTLPVKHLFVRRPLDGWQPINVPELWQHRELVWFLGIRDIQLRYKQTLLGVGWAVIQPLVMALVLTLFFGQLGGLQRTLKSGVPYAVFVLVGLLPWQMFAQSVIAMGNSLVSNQSLVTKVHFPRLLIPLAAVIPSLLDFIVGAFLLAALMIFYGVRPRLTSMLLGLGFLLLTIAAASAVGLWAAALNVEYRDIRHTLPFLVQVGLLTTPIAYPTALIPPKWATLYAMNPMVVAVEGFRWALLGYPAPPISSLAVSASTTTVFLVTALYYFRRVEGSFADQI